MRQGWKKKLLAALVLMTLGGTPVVLAEDAGTTVVTNVTNINVYKTEEIKGTELGTDARARGTGSIATGKGAIAIGKNAVATGGNETKASIEAKLAENQAKLDEISALEQSTDTLAAELTELRNTSASVIEAGQRVEAVKIAKTKAYDNWQAKEKEYQDAVTASQAYLDEQQAKIDDLNSRLTGVSQLTNTDISSDEGLTAAANELKAIAEKDTTLNLSTDFYKDYVSSYYKALGDLRQANAVYSKADPNSYRKDGRSCNENVLINSYSVYSDKVSYGIAYYYSSSCSSVLCCNTTYSTLDKGSFKNSTVTNTPSANISLKNTDVDITTQVEWETAQAAAPEWKAALAQFFTDCNNPMLSDEAKEAWINQMNLKVDYYLKTNEITYYQWQYEETGDTTWLDKKKAALTELSAIQSAWDAAPKGSTITRQNIDKYKEENITSVSEKNKVTTATLTAELETALGISKDAVTQKEKELAALQKQAEQAKTNYENVAPTQQDTYLSQSYTEVMADLEKKAAELKSSQERLAALKAALTLNDFTDVGENAMAVGTDSLATGKNAMAVGTSAIATGENAIAVGNGAIVTGKDSIAIGTGNVVLGEGSGAIGDPNTIYASRSYALGNNNQIGAVKDDLPDATVGLNTFVLGNYVTTTANNSVILGNASADNGENDIVSVGSSALQRKIIYVANGTENTDAATYGQLVNAKGVTTKTTEDGVEKETTTYTPYEADSDGIVTIYTNDNQVAFTFKMNPIGTSDTSTSGGGASSAALTAEVTAREKLLKSETDETIRIGGGTGGTKIDVSNSTGETRVIKGIRTDPTDGTSAANISYVNTVYNRMQSGMSSLENRLTEDNRTVGAVSAALAGLKPMAYTPEDKWGFAAATGTYRGTTATALGLFYQPNEDILFNLGSTVGADHNAWNAGFSIKFGRKTARSIPKGDTTDQLAALRQENEKLRRDIEEMRAKHDADMQNLSAKIAALAEKVR